MRAIVSRISTTCGVSMGRLVAVDLVADVALRLQPLEEELALLLAFPRNAFEVLLDLDLEDVEEALELLLLLLVLAVLQRLGLRGRFADRREELLDVGLGLVLPDGLLDGLEVLAIGLHELGELPGELGGLSAVLLVLGRRLGEQGEEADPAQESLHARDGITSPPRSKAHPRRARRSR